jgi:hypothetical protein
LDEHTAYIAADSRNHAREWLAEAWEKIFSLSNLPKRFAVIPESEELGIELRDMHHFLTASFTW